MARQEGFASYELPKESVSRENLKKELSDHTKSAKVILDEIKTSAKKIIRDENQYLDNEICRLCRLMNNNNPCPM